MPMSRPLAPLTKWRSAKRRADAVSAASSSVVKGRMVPIALVMAGGVVAGSSSLVLLSNRVERTARVTLDCK